MGSSMGQWAYITICCWMKCFSFEKCRVAWLTTFHSHAQSNYFVVYYSILLIVICVCQYLSLMKTPSSYCFSEYRQSSSSASRTPAIFQQEQGHFHGHASFIIILLGNQLYSFFFLSCGRSSTTDINNSNYIFYWTMDRLRSCQICQSLCGIPHPVVPSAFQAYPRQM